MKLVSRSQWGARAYRTPNGATPYSRARRGVKLHYLGTAYSDRAHDKCAAYVRQLQAQHMDGNGWSDIGYSFLVCTHGYVYEGRGLKRRNSANGNTGLNDQDYAVCLLVGSSGLTKPTDDQLHGARDAIEYCRKEGPAGTWLGGHRDGFATACPGDAVYAWVKAGAPRPAGSSPAPKPATTPTAPAAPSPEAPMTAPSMLSEANAIDVELTSGEWTGLALKDAVLHAGPCRHDTTVHLLFGEAPEGATVEGRYYLTDTKGGSKSDYLPDGPHPLAGGGHQFTCVGDVPAGRHLRFEVRVTTPDASPVTLLHRSASGPYWAL
ncbi:N-acetylmuramoyl-L-alanine amidase [Streptomyces pilosus]|uniref:N-acetylmuramoyl-L-alanine amidase n=1 Tax=Streptomyces pilosus TaxID=28893 RepID=UPI00362F164A